MGSGGVPCFFSNTNEYPTMPDPAVARARRETAATGHADSGRETAPRRANRGRDSGGVTRYESLSPEVREVMKQHKLSDSRSVLNSENAGKAGEVSLKTKLELISAMLAAVTAKVAPSNSTLVPAELRTGILNPPSGLIDRFNEKDLEELYELDDGAAPPSKYVTETLSNDESVGEQEGAAEAGAVLHTTVTRRLTEKEYKQALLDGLPEDIKKEIRKDHVGQFLREKREYQAASKACFDYLMSLMTSTTKRRISSYKDFKEIEAGQILVGDRSLRTLLVLAWQELFAGVCPQIAAAGAIVDFASLAMKKGGNFDEHFDVVREKAEAMENVGGVIVTEESLEVALKEYGLSTTRRDESLEVSEMLTVIAGAGKAVNAAIALHQVKEGKPAFFAYKVNAYHEGAKSAIPTTLDELNTAVGNFVEPEVEEAEGRRGGSPDTEREERTLATGRQRQGFRCFRCNGNHQVAECSITVEMVRQAFPEQCGVTPAPPEEESEAPVAGVNATAATFDAYPELDGTTW